ncbi:transcription factor RAX2-like [Oryza brachyantha]|uniref:Uncharacterized protein n=1 Tax=Oryza brachyantha TaxID=4533 RepID=J3L3L8_ORYBR|nr:transcription factor RAX2-like [Oryza brachyantha]
MGRSPCCDKSSVKRGPWSQEEDAILRSFVERFGNAGNWIALPHKAGLKRCGKSCRLRWLNYLRPAIRHGGFTDEEDNLILSLYGEMGSKWSVIASKLPGRTDNDVKNYWNTKLKKRYLSTTREVTTPPSPAAGDDSIAAVDSPSQASSQPSPPPPPAIVNLDAPILDSTGDDNAELLHKSEQLYAELMGLIEQQSMITAAAPSTRDAATTSWSPPGTSPTASSSCDGSSMQMQWPVDVHESTVPLSSESSNSSSSSSASSLWFFDAFGGGSFQDLLGAASFDDVMLSQEMLYY